MERSEAIATGMTARIEIIKASIRYAQNLGNSGAGDKPIRLTPFPVELPKALFDEEAFMGVVGACCSDFETALKFGRVNSKSIAPHEGHIRNVFITLVPHF